jgi:hypothetical protein
MSERLRAQAPPFKAPEDVAEEIGAAIRTSVHQFEPKASKSLAGHILRDVLAAIERLPITSVIRLKRHFYDKGKLPAVTPAMKEAGAAVVANLKGNVSDDHLAEQVYVAMERAIDTH